MKFTPKPARVNRFEEELDALLEKHLGCAFESGKDAAEPDYLALEKEVADLRKRRAFQSKY